MNYEEATARCWAEVNLDEVRGNFRRACQIVGPDVKVICVLKGDAYGLGAPVVAGALMREGASFFAVASGDEAEELLDVCPGADVLVLGRVGEGQMRRLIERDAILTLYSAQQGETVIRAASAAGKPARVHVKAETGLYRLGFSGTGAAMEIARLNESGMLKMEGLFTHLALHDREEDEKQFARLDAMRNALAECGIAPGMVHALDSIGMVRYPHRHMDAVRVGAWLYGNCPNRYEHPENCRPTMRFKARVAQLHDVAAGERIGYDDDHYLEKDCTIATLSAGYVDGVPRLNNEGEVEIRGKRTRVVGLVCMDQMMVDVTGLDVREGDEAVFFGEGIDLPEYSAWGKLNRNEALARVARRVPRVYTENGKFAGILNRMEDNRLQAANIPAGQ